MSPNIKSTAVLLPCFIFLTLSTRHNIPAQVKSAAHVPELSIHTAASASTEVQAAWLKYPRSAKTADGLKAVEADRTRGTDPAFG